MSPFVTLSPSIEARLADVRAKHRIRPALKAPREAANGRSSHAKQIKWRISEDCLRMELPFRPYLRAQADFLTWYFKSARPILTNFYAPTIADEISMPSLQIGPSLIFESIGLRMLFFKN